MSEAVMNAETAVRTAMDAVVGGRPQDARVVLNALSFDARSMLAGWADELQRLVTDAQMEYTARERSEWRGVRGTAAN